MLSVTVTAVLGLAQSAEKWRSPVQAAMPVRAEIKHVYKDTLHTIVVDVGHKPNKLTGRSANQSVRQSSKLHRHALSASERPEETATVSASATSPSAIRPQTPYTVPRPKKRPSDADARKTGEREQHPRLLE